MLKHSLCKTLLSASVLVLSLPASASTWNFMFVGNDSMRVFFDADTILKNKDKSMLIWIKTVQTTQPDSDGSWATAARWKVNCNKRTIQSMASSTYDQNNKFIKSSTLPVPESEATPDSIGEATLKIVCEQNFPNETGRKEYFPINNNDVFDATRRYQDMVKSGTDTAPK